MHSSIKELFHTNRLLKEGRMELSSVFKHLVFWVDSQASVKIFNAAYLPAKSRGESPCLLLIFETKQELMQVTRKDGQLKGAFREFALNTFSALVEQLKLQRTYPCLGLRLEAFELASVDLTEASLKVLRWDKVLLMARTSGYGASDVWLDGLRTVFYLDQSAEENGQVCPATIRILRNIYYQFCLTYAPDCEEQADSLLFNVVHHSVQNTKSLHSPSVRLSTVIDRSERRLAKQAW